jgi:hypothetical protein
MTVKKCLAIAALITLLQVAAAVLMTPEDDNPRLTYWSVVYYFKWETAPPDYSGWIGKYRRLNEFDSIHYLSIAENGYIQSGNTPSQQSIYSYKDNEGFFPGYPYTARLISFLGIPPDIALLLVAQLFTWITWFYLLLILRRNQVEWGSRASIVATLIAFPATLYLVTGYAESTFIANMLGMIYWYGESKRPDLSKRSQLFFVTLSALHGMWMTATRLVGLPLALYPLLVESVAALRRKKPQWLNGLLVATVTPLGGLLYFAYLDFAFGRWDYYFFIQKSGWFLQSDLKSIFQFSAYFQNAWAYDLVHIADVAIVLGMTTYLLVLMYRLLRQQNFLKFTPLLYMCLALFYIPFVTMYLRRMEGMVRYVLPSLFLVAVILAENRTPPSRPRTIWEPVLLVISLWVQYLLMSAFLHGYWVA